MGKYRETRNYHESDDTEVAYFVPSWYPDDTATQSVAIAPLADNEVSIMMCRIYTEYEKDFIHMIFVEKEVDMLIDALVECKKRWVESRVYERSEIE